MSSAIQIIDRFAAKQCSGNYPCPRCGRMDMDEHPTRNAMSRRVNVYVCDFCGTVEAIEDAIDSITPVEEWVINKNPELFGMEVHNENP